MVVRIRSLLVSGPVVIPLNTGSVLRLSPGEVSDELPDVEVADNAKVGKLLRQRVIEVDTDAAPGGPAEAEAGGGEGEGGGSEPRTRARKRTGSAG